MNRAIIYQQLIHHLETRIQELKEAITSLKEEQAEGGKSAMGDKYETSAELTRTEIEKFQVQWNQYQKWEATVKNFAAQSTSSLVKPGSIVFTDTQVFLVGIAVGKLSVKQQDIYCLSAASPMGQALLGKKVGQSISLNQQELKIKKLW